MQSWERLLFGSGGGLAVKKGFWWLLAFTWLAGKASSLKIADSGAEIALTSGRDQQQQVVKQLELSESRETLGVWQNPLRTMGAEYIKRRGMSEALAKRIRSSSLSSTKAESLFWGVWLQRIGYS